MKFLQLIQ